MRCGVILCPREGDIPPCERGVGSMGNFQHMPLETETWEKPSLT